MLINGKKWACDVCIRGHRVIKCHHNDRLLNYVKRKGRPASQCDHCRILRKSHSIHLRCHHPDKDSINAEICCCVFSGRYYCVMKNPHTGPNTQWLRKGSGEPQILNTEPNTSLLTTAGPGRRLMAIEDGLREREHGCIDLRGPGREKVTGLRETERYIYLTLANVVNTQ